jgi:hypothetical protein
LAGGFLVGEAMRGVKDPVPLLGDIGEQELGLVAVHLGKSWHVVIVSARSAHPLHTFGAKIRA